MSCTQQDPGGSCGVIPSTVLVGHLPLPRGLRTCEPLPSAPRAHMGTSETDAGVRSKPRVSVLPAGHRAGRVRPPHCPLPSRLAQPSAPLLGLPDPSGTAAVRASGTVLQPRAATALIPASLFGATKPSERSSKSN